MIVEVARIIDNSVNARIALEFQEQSFPKGHRNQVLGSLAVVCVNLLCKYVRIEKEFVKTLAMQLSEQNRLAMLALGVACCLLSQSGCAVMGRFSPLRPLERSLIYYPAKPPAQSNTELAGSLEDARFQSSDGTQLHGIFINHPKPVAVALWMHGNAGNVSHRVDSLRLLSERHGMAALVFDYRGYGKSEGKPDEKGILEDARAARAWLANRMGVAESEIVLMGRSLGGGVAVDLAAKDGARGLVLASTFTSLPDAGKAQLPWVPTSLLMTQRLDSLSKIGDYTGPLLQSHGDADKVIPYELGQQLFAAANEPKQFVTIKGGGHNDPQSEEYRRALDRFLAELP